MSPRLPPLNSLRAFEATARHMSFTKAAGELNVTPAALSHQVKALEQTLQLALFHRRSRAIELTEAGRLLYPGVHAGFETLMQAVARLQVLRDDRVLVISAGPGFTVKWLVPRLYSFLERHPDIDARMSANLAFSDFATDGVDVAIRFGRGGFSGLYEKELFPEFVLPLCSPDVRDGDPPLRAPSDLRHVQLIHDDSLEFAEESPNWQTWLDAAGVTGVDARRGLRFNIADHALDAAIEGAGVVLARRVVADHDMRTGRLVAPFELELPVGMSFYLVCPEGTEELPKVRAFRDWLESELNADAVAP